MEITDINGAVTLKNGVTMPYFGLGVFRMSDGKEVIEAVKNALATGYKHIDTASLYGNERGVGQAILQSDIARKDIFVTSKVWNSDQGYDATFRAFDRSMKLLGFDYLDLYLVHWPVKGKYRETWKALETLYREKRIRAIGVSNFLEHHLENLLAHCNEAPMVNQMEFHPYLIQQDLIDYCQKRKVQYEAWSPLLQGKIIGVPQLKLLAVKYGKNVAQLVLRWDLQKGVVTIPKSVHKDRIISNTQIFDFEITPEDMETIDKLDRHERIGADPDNFDF